MLNINNYYRNANQNYNEIFISSYQSERPSSKCPKTNSGEGDEKMEISYTIDGNVNL